MIEAKQIENNWNQLMEYIEKYISEDRKFKLIKMYDDFKDRMMLAPASAKEHYHKAIPGVYVEHILHIIENSLQLKELWEKNGALINFT